MKIIVCASLAYSLVNFRGALLAALAKHHDVIACAPDDDPAVTAQLEKAGVQFRRIPMRRASISPLADLRTLGAYVSLFREQRPDVVLAYTQKPIIYAGIAARLTRQPRFFAMVTGLGHAFGDGGGRGRMLLRWAVAFLYRHAVRRAETVFVFNSDDGPELISQRIVGPGHRVIQLPGSGVDLRRYSFAPLPTGPAVFLLIARLLRDKGLQTFVEAARHVRQVHPDARFQLLGPFDENPECISRNELEAWQQDGSVEYLGSTTDVVPHLHNATAFVLPSSYREGLPRTILEALSTGRPIITTDTPGCREAVIDGENGFLVPKRDSRALSRAMLQLIEDPDRALRFGARSRELAERVFAVEKVNAVIQCCLEAVPERRQVGATRLRRVTDMLAATLAILLLLPVLAALVLACLATLGRPVFFRQRRAGLAGRPFFLLKLRTMVEPAREADRLSTDRARVTAFGRFLRRSRLDELPGLFNVLAGDMSIIGPRPLLPETIESMGALGLARCRMRPGLTGWAQVNGGPLLSADAKLALDLWYLEHASIRLDLLILLRTALVVFRGDRITPATEALYAGAGRRSG